MFKFLLTSCTRGEVPGYRQESAASRGHSAHPPPLTLSLTYIGKGCEDEDPKTSLYPRPLRRDHVRASGWVMREGKDQRLNQEQDAAAGTEGRVSKGSVSGKPSTRQHTSATRLPMWKAEESLIRKWKRENLNPCTHTLTKYFNIPRSHRVNS